MDSNVKKYSRPFHTNDTFHSNRQKQNDFKTYDTTSFTNTNIDFLQSNLSTFLAKATAEYDHSVYIV